jgi:hypothetical protein
MSIREFRTDNEDVPWSSRTVTFVGNGTFTQTKTGKLEMLGQRGRIVAVWSGQWTSDAFVVDRRAAKKALTEGTSS